MRISNLQNINFTGNQNKEPDNLKGKNALKAAGTIAGGWAVGMLGFAAKDVFIDSQKYLKSVQGTHDSFNKQIEDRISETIKKRNSWGEKVEADEIEILRNLYKIQNNDKLDKNLGILKNERNLGFKQGLKIFSGIGISLGILALVVKNYLDKKTTKNNLIAKNTQQNFKNSTPHQSFFLTKA